MGNARLSSADYTAYHTRSIAGKSREEIFTAKEVNPNLNPKNVRRESRDSEANPASNAIIVGVDLTGSMGYLSEVLVREGMKTLITEIYDRKPVSDPHVMVMGIGDVEARDRGPLQLTQFEADVRIFEQLTQIWIEGGGGGNGYESYTLPWYFAAKNTTIDCFEKRGKKGYLFTIGDEPINPVLRKNEIEGLIGGTEIKDRYTAKELYDMVSERYHVYHLMVEAGDYFRVRGDSVVKSWNEVIGENAIRLSDHTKIAEVIVSKMQLNEGVPYDEVIASWDKGTSKVVEHAIGHFNLRR